MSPKQEGPTLMASGSYRNDWAERIRTELLEVSLAHSSLSHKLRSAGNGGHCSDTTLFAIAQKNDKSPTKSRADVHTLQKPGGSGRRMKDFAAKQRNKKADVTALTTKLELPVFQQSQAVSCPRDEAVSPQSRKISAAQRAKSGRCLRISAAKTPTKLVDKEDGVTYDFPHSHDVRTGAVRKALSGGARVSTNLGPRSQSSQTSKKMRKKSECISEKRDSGRKNGKLQHKATSSAQSKRRPSHFKDGAAKMASAGTQATRDKHERTPTSQTDCKRPQKGCSETIVSPPRDEGVYRVVSVSEYAAKPCLVEVPHHEVRIEQQAVEGQCTESSSHNSTEKCRVLIARDHVGITQTSAGRICYLANPSKDASHVPTNDENTFVDQDST